MWALGFSTFHIFATLPLPYFRFFPPLLVTHFFSRNLPRPVPRNRALVIIGVTILPPPPPAMWHPSPYATTFLSLTTQLRGFVSFPPFFLRALGRCPVLIRTLLFCSRWCGPLLAGRIFFFPPNELLPPPTDVG